MKFTSTHSAKKLTALAVDKAATRARVYYLADGENSGLRLRVRPNGKKTWTLRVYVGGRETAMGLGSASDISLADARSRADDIRKRIRLGQPVRDKVEPKPEEERKPTFGVRWKAYVKDKGGRWSEPHRKRNEMLYRLHLAPTLADKPIDTITEDTLLGALLPVAKTRKESARRSLALAALVFRLAISERLCSANPAKKLIDERNDFFRRDEDDVEHHAAVTPLQLALALRALDANENYPLTTRAALWLVATTALREGTVRKLEWSMLDEKASTLTIPRAIMKSKKGRPFVTAVGPRVLKMLTALPREKDSVYIFASSASRAGYLASNTLRLALRETSGEPTTAHGLRATWMDMAEMFDASNFTSKRQLDHSLGKLTEAYARSDLLDKRRIVVEKIERWLISEGKKNGKA